MWISGDERKEGEICSHLCYAQKQFYTASFSLLFSLSLDRWINGDLSFFLILSILSILSTLLFCDSYVCRGSNENGGGRRGGGQVTEEEEGEEDKWRKKRGRRTSDGKERGRTSNGRRTEEEEDKGWKERRTMSSTVRGVTTLALRLTIFFCTKIE